MKRQYLWLTPFVVTNEPKRLPPFLPSNIKFIYIIISFIISFIMFSIGWRIVWRILVLVIMADCKDVWRIVWR